MPRLAALALIALAAAVAAGCGGDSATEAGTSVAPAPHGAGGKAPIGASARSCGAEASGAESLRTTGVPCGQARRVLHDWQRQPSCALPAGASRGSCLTRSYRCQAVRADRGLAVSCVHPGQSLAFIARRR